MASLWLPKLLYTLFFGGYGAVNSFLPVFFKDDKHLSLAEIGILGMLSPLVKFIGAPLLSGLADSTRQHRIILYISLFLSVLFRFSLVFAPNDFPTCVTFVILAEALGSVAAPIFENGVLELLPDKALYGRQRLFGAAGYGVAVLVSGLLVEAAGASWPMFVNQTVQLTLFAIMSRKLPLPSDKPHMVKAVELPLSIQAEDHDDNNDSDDNSDNSNAADTTMDDSNPEYSTTDHEATPAKPRFTDVLKVITRDVYTTCFFLVIVLSGMGAGVIENFLFIYIEELGGDKTIQGLARFVMCAAEIPLFFYSGYIFDKLGTTGCLTLTFLAFIARFVFYAYMTNPWTVVAAGMHEFYNHLELENCVPHQKSVVYVCRAVAWGDVCCHVVGCYTTSSRHCSSWVGYNHARYCASAYNCITLRWVIKADSYDRIAWRHAFWSRQCTWGFNWRVYLPTLRLQDHISSVGRCSRPQFGTVVDG
eukprot:m.58061 g.58061  ORF g.58061 m.58061 type:complete len:476 (-) comp13753_c0_seq35:758-2185(-)